MKEDLKPRDDDDVNIVFEDNHSSLSSSGFEHSDDELNYNSCDETLAILNTVDSSKRSRGLSRSGDTPLVRCCVAFWDLSSYCTLFLTSIWISFLFLMLIQPSMSDIRREIADIDPLSARNHPLLHRSRSDPFCSNYTLSDLAQFSFLLTFSLSLYL